VLVLVLVLLLPRTAMLHHTPRLHPGWPAACLCVGLLPVLLLLLLECSGLSCRALLHA
jgi:hypothetical protein